MLRKKTGYIAGWLLLSAVLFPSLPGALASGVQSPWQFAFTLLGQGKSMSLPVALYVDEERARYYVVDSGGNKLVSFDKDGKFLQEFTAEGSLQKPHDMARLSDGSLLLVERGRNSLTRIDLKNKKSDPILLSHQGREVFVDRLETAAGKVYVLDRTSGQILQLDEKLQTIRAFALPAAAVGNLIDFKVMENRIWLLDQKNKQIHSFDDSGRPGSPVQLQQVAFPVSLAVDQAGFFYVLDRNQGAIVVFDRNGEFKYRFLTKGHGRQNLYFPRELRFDPWGRLCVVDQGNSRVLVFKR